MLGIILCGGQSSRMGSDKGLLMHEAKTWAQTALEKLSVLNIPIRLSVNEMQQSEYEKVFTPELLIVDNPALSIKGPLLGVLSAHLQNPAKDLFLLACDLPLMEPNLLKELFALHKQSKKYDVYIFTNDREPEPLCGIYTSKALKKIIALQQDNKLIRHSMKFILNHLVVCQITLQENQKVYFRNFNAHADVNGL
ncbi:molybdenum cofactor guanylyltransferase [Ferruginibacter sp.]|nr:molybdenum cofactor guanylyltransferase [Ferruginibacter sp.]